ncbi:MAG TPA: M56 family metallopeptidase [Roseimicrobium sp.]|nr:M56 family metallopeptidase [Roseimicrobium sp.]
MDFIAKEGWGTLEWLWRSTWQGSLLILAVLAVQWVFRKQLTPRWRYSLWAVVVIRLALPVTPESAFSVYNWTRVPSPAPQAAPPSQVANSIERTAPDAVQPPPFKRFPFQGQNPALNLPPTGDSTSTPASQPPQQRKRIPWPLVIALIWIAGIAMLILRVAVASLTLSRTLGVTKDIDDLEILSLLNDCRRSMGVTQSIRLVEVEKLGSPALCGWWRPRLLLPAGLVRQFDLKELRFVFLHELAHVRRHDVLQNWLLTAVQILHWFNPVVWLAFHRLRADRELACDALALSHTQENENKSYGETILKLLQGFVQPSPTPGLVGILEDRKQLKERITMIAQFRRTSTWSTLAALLLVGLSLGCLTDARKAATKPQEKPKAAVSSTNNTAAKPATITTPAAAPVQATASATPSAKPAAPKPVIAGIRVDASQATWSAVPGNGWSPFILGLSNYYSDVFDAPTYKSAGQSVPKGRQEVDGIPFVVGGHVQFYGTSAASFSERGQRYRDGLYDIPVNRKFAQLHLLHHAMWQGADGSQLATVVFHYADGSNVRFPIIYGRQVRDWFFMKYEAEEILLDPDTHIYWRGDHREASQYQATVRAFKSTLTNPKPWAVVSRIDFVSAKNMASYGLFAATLTEKAVPAPKQIAPELAARNRGFSESITLVFKDPAGNAITNATFTTYCEDNVGGYLMGGVATDKDGQIVIRYPKDTLKELSFTARAPGFIPQNADFTGPALPKSTNIILQAGVEIGGKVLGKDGKALPGAVVNTSHVSTPQKKDDYLNLRTVTDANGLWRIDGFPKGASGVTLYVTHTNYPDTSFASPGMLRAPNNDGFTVDDLYASTAVFSMRPGLILSGRVTGPDGAAVSNARVLASYYYTTDDSKRTLTAADGSFALNRLGGVGPRDMLLVNAPGFAPFKMSASRASETGKPVNIILTRAKPLKLVVQDSAGKPVQGASVNLNSWEGSSILQWQSTTDAKGETVWTNPPQGFVEFNVTHPAFVPENNIGIQGDQGEFTFTLQKASVISGRVIDAKTKQPVESFQIYAGTQYNPLQIQWSDQPLYEGKGGRFEFSSGLLRSGQRLRVVAGTYLPEATDRITDLSKPAEFTLELQEGTGPGGVVLQPDGKPAASAQVALHGNQQSGLYLRDNLALEQYGGIRRISRTDDQGRFVLKPEPGAPRLIAVHSTGMAEIPQSSFPTNGVIQLKAWGTIEGQMTAPFITGEELTLTPDTGFAPGAINLGNAYRVQVGRDGRFVISNAPPMSVRIHRLVPISTNSWTYSFLDNVDVKPGVVTRAMQGKTGRVVKCSLPASSVLSIKPWKHGFASLSSINPQEPKGIKDYRAWLASDEYRDSMKDQRSYIAIPDANGAFQFLNVRPGKYSLRLPVQEKADREEDPLGVSRELGYASLTVTVSDESTPLELPALTYTPAQR